MKKKLIHDKSYYRITYNEIEIDVHGNHFGEMEEAETYLETHMIKLPGTYGVVKIHKTLWEFV